MQNRLIRCFPHLLLGFALTVSVVVFSPSAAFAKKGKGYSIKSSMELIAQNPEDWVSMAEGTRVADAELGELRGGFWDPTGLILRFAVDVKTQIDGALTFVRSMVLEPVVGHHGFHAESSAKVMSENLPQDMSAEMINQGTGAIITGKEGTTKLMTQTANGALASIVLNTADNRTISQTMNIDLVLSNMSATIGNLSVRHNMHAPAGLGQIAHMHTVGFGL